MTNKNLSITNNRLKRIPNRHLAESAWHESLPPVTLTSKFGLPATLVNSIVIYR
jgi:hypothetical protein